MIITTSCSAWHVFYYLTRDLTQDIESSDKELDTGKSQSAFKRRRRRRREGEKNRILTRPTVWPKVVMSEYRGFRPALGILGEYDNGSLLFFFFSFFRLSLYWSTEASAVVICLQLFWHVTCLDIPRWGSRCLRVPWTAMCPYYVIPHTVATTLAVLLPNFFLFPFDS